MRRHRKAAPCGQRRTESRRATLLSALYRLTAAEVSIAQMLAVGNSADDIAAHRGASVGTVRFQIKAILAKCGVKRQTELVALLNQL